MGRTQQMAVGESEMVLRESPLYICFFLGLKPDRQQSLESSQTATDMHSLPLSDSTAPTPCPAA